MNKRKCPACGSAHTKKNGKRKGKQTYKCCECGCQFRSERLPSKEELWYHYQSGKQTIAELSVQYGVSASTVKRLMRGIAIEWENPRLEGGGYVHMDAAYWGHNWGVMLALDSRSGQVLHLAFIQNEKTSDYQNAVESIERRGYVIKGIVLDGRQNVFKALSSYRLQMCHFHMREIIRRYLTMNPRLRAARELNALMKRLTTSSRRDFETEYAKWKEEWNETLNRRSTLKNGRTQFRHKRLRSAMHSIDWYLPYLFTFLNPGCEGMPNTNNKIEGTFSDLKKNINNHSGMSKENRKPFICSYFNSSNNDSLPE